MRRYKRLVMAAVFVLTIIGCGGGGKGKNGIKMVKTEIRGTVVDESDRPLSGARVAAVGSHLDSETDQAGRFKILVETPDAGSVRLVVTHQLISGSTTLPVYNLVGGVYELTSPIKLIPNTRTSTFDPSCARTKVPITVTVSVAGRETLPDQVVKVTALSGEGTTDIAKQYQGPFDFRGKTFDLGEWNVGKWYFQAPTPLKAEIVLLFRNINGPTGPAEHLMATTVIEFVDERDTIPPTLTVNPLEGVQKGTITITGQAHDSQSESRATLVDSIDLDLQTFRTRESCSFEAPASGVKFVQMSCEDASIVKETKPQNDRFSFELDTTALTDGQHELVFLAVDNAGNWSSPVHMTIEVDNIPPVDPWDLLVTIPDKLVLANEPPRRFSWSPYGGSIDAVTFGLDDTMYVNTGYVSVFPRSGEPWFYPDFAGKGGMGVDQAGHIFVASFLESRIVRFTPDGQRIDRSVNFDYLGGPDFLFVDDVGNVWTWKDGDVFHYDNDLRKVGELKLDAVDLLALSVSQEYDSLFWYTVIERGTLSIMRRILSSAQDVEIARLSKWRGVYGLQFVPEKGQILLLTAIGNSTDPILVQIDKHGQEINVISDIPEPTSGDGQFIHLAPQNPAGSFYLYSVNGEEAIRYQFE